jgi:hypothetical protein
LALLWNVHNPDGSRAGPLPTEQLIAGLVRGSISAQAWIRRTDDTTWQPVSSVEALGDFADPDARGGTPRTELRFLLACGAVLFAFAVGVVGF